MEQEHRITYKAGITRTPSDFLCQDGELAECINLATDNEELKPVVQPASYITSAENTLGDAMEVPIILYIHKFNDEERYIGYREMVQHGHTLYPLCWYTKDGTKLIYQADFQSNGSIYYTNDINITSIGKTIIVTNVDGFTYFLWKTDEYLPIGDIPDIDIEYWLDLRTTSSGQHENGRAISEGLFTEILEYRDDLFTDILNQEEYNDLIVGLYAKNKKIISQKKAFCNPFFVRAALEMYDGSYTRITNPVLMFPSVTRNSYASHNDLHSRSDNIQLITQSLWLFCSQKTDFSAFSDVIKGVTLFVTEDIDVNDILADQEISLIDTGGLLYNRIYRSGNSTISDYDAQTERSSSRHYKALAERDKNDVVDEIKSSSIFYKLCSIGLKEVTDLDTSTKILKHTLENLLNQERLPYDDFYSRNKLYPKFVYSYNSRLNIANAERGFFEGFGNFLPYDNSDSDHIYDFYVTIETDVDEFTVHHQEQTYQKQGIYFFYPDSRAKHVVIFKDNSCILDVDLEEHPMLNGAFYFSGRPHIDVEEPSGASAQIPAYNNNAKEIIPNYILQSEVNNPWVFSSKGYLKVGTGKIIGMSTITQALSQGQFGQYPLLVFSESGIWALSVGSEGYYTAIHPMSRDVCINPGSILQTDGAVFFVSKKGLMVVAGKEVVCVSERMNGATFNTAQLSPLAADTDWEDIVEACQDSNSFLDYIRDEGMFMAYDYIDSRIVMVNPRFSYSFIYNIADATISKVILPAAMTNAVNNYPDYLIQGLTDDNHQRVYSFYEKKREEEVTGRQLGFLLTRPMKLSGPVSQASLQQLKNVGTWIRKDMQGNELSCVKTEVYLSEDMQRWYYDKSRHGAAARYYRLALFIRMLPTERLSGTILTEQERRSHNMR